MKCNGGEAAKGTCDKREYENALRFSRKVVNESTERVEFERAPAFSKEPPVRAKSSCNF